MDIKNIREDYVKGNLLIENMHANPFNQFEQWFEEGQTSGQPLPNAVSLATVDASGMPSIRAVLLKAVGNNGFVFFTNYTSAKAKDIGNNPNVALLCFWPTLERQISIRGVAEKITSAETEAYFSHRPYFSQLGAWASHQSQIIPDRDELNKRFESFKKQFSEGQVPCPDFWGGYCVKPITIEFWQGRPNRLHDRLRYKQQHKENWIIERLSP